MDYYQGVVVEYLRADRAIFVNTECCIQLNDSPNPDTSGPHWYCDAVAVDFRHPCAFLCEISYSESLSVLLARLSTWNSNWPLLCKALNRDSHVPANWPVRPWLFVPLDRIEAMLRKLQLFRPSMGEYDALPIPRVTPLEMVVPWSYSSYNRIGEHDKPASIPDLMR